MSTKWIDNDFNVRQLSLHDGANKKDESKLKDNALDKIIEKFLSADLKVDEKKKSIYKNYDPIKVFEKNKKIIINNRNLYYNMVTFSFDKIRPSSGMIPEEERTTSVKGYVIIYTDGQNIYYITDRNSDARTILRRIMDYQEYHAIKQIELDITNDFIIWLINKIYNKQNTMETSDGSIVLNEIVGLKGGMRDDNTTLKADGPSVMNIISTLSLLLESDDLSSISLVSSAPNHDKISLDIKTNEYLEIKDSEYSGIYREELDENNNYDDFLCKLNLYIYNDFLSKLLQLYQDDIENNLWSLDQYNKLMNNVAEAIKEKIEIEVNRISKKMD